MMSPVTDPAVLEKEWGKFKCEGFDHPCDLWHVETLTEREFVMLLPAFVEPLVDRIIADHNRYLKERIITAALVERHRYLRQRN